MINDFDKAAKDINDPQIRAFAGTEKDSLLHHLDRIITIKDSININKNPRSASR